MGRWIAIGTTVASIRTVRVMNPRSGEWQLQRRVTHPAVPPGDAVGRLDNANVHHRWENTIPEYVTRFAPPELCRRVF